MKKFLSGLLSDSNGTPSSKRMVMFMLTVLFIFILIVNLWTGKNLDETLKNQLFYLLCWMFSMVLGERVVNIFGKKNPVKTDTKTDQP
jgi:hypothetical protein